VRKTINFFKVDMKKIIGLLSLMLMCISAHAKPFTCPAISAIKVAGLDLSDMTLSVVEEDLPPNAEFGITKTVKSLTCNYQKIFNEKPYLALKLMIIDGIEASNEPLINSKLQEAYKGLLEPKDKRIQTALVQIDKGLCGAMLLPQVMQVSTCQAFRSNKLVSVLIVDPAFTNTQATSDVPLSFLKSIEEELKP
jgi:hypothetical protein